MTSLSPVRVCLFTLDGTLFDEYHAARCGVAAATKTLPFQKAELVELVDLYRASSRKVQKLRGNQDTSYGLCNELIVADFFQAFNLPAPSLQTSQRFSEIYNTAFTCNLRTTPGTIEALCRLEESGYTIIVVTNKRREEQVTRIKQIGLSDLVSHVVSSSEIGFTKLDPRIILEALKLCKADPSEACFVGNCVDADIKCGIAANVSSILYSPLSQESTCMVDGRPIAIVRDMTDLLPNLAAGAPHFEPKCSNSNNSLVIEGLGFDMVTQPHHCLHMAAPAVLEYTNNVSQTLLAIGSKDYGRALVLIEGLIRTVARAASIIDENAIQIQFPQPVDNRVAASIEHSVNITYVQRTHSFQVLHLRTILGNACDELSKIQNVAQLIQQHYHYLMQDWPRAATRILRDMMFQVAEMCGLENDLIVLVDAFRR